MSKNQHPVNQCFQSASEDSLLLEFSKLLGSYLSELKGSDIICKIEDKGYQIEKGTFGAYFKFYKVNLDVDPSDVDLNAPPLSQEEWNKKYGHRDFKPIKWDQNPDLAINVDRDKSLLVIREVHISKQGYYESVRRSSKKYRHRTAEKAMISFRKLVEKAFGKPDVSLYPYAVLD